MNSSGPGSPVGTHRTRIREAGDSAFLLQLDAVIDPGVNERAVAIARAIAEQRLTGVRDVIPTFRSVAVHFDPLASDSAALTRAMLRAAEAPPTSREGDVIEVPVAYGGTDGPDLREVATFAGLSESAVIERHAAVEYRVFMLGFLPGFAYMGLVDEAIAAPRKASPRLRVPVGSVGIAGRQTGIYPRVSPGGWQLIGRTGLQLFDPSSDQVSLFAPGDRVRFLPVPAVAGPDQPDLPRRSPALQPRSITVLRAGLLTTIQDTGRWGHQHLGVPVAGPMDSVSHRIANALVGNARDAATLEATVLGPDLRFEQPVVIAVTGADLSASLDGDSVPLNTPRFCPAGAVLRMGGRRAGARAYIACDGGVIVPPVLGSRATHVLSALGGIDGRALAAGDRLPLGDIQSPGARPYGGPLPAGRVEDVLQGGARLRIMRGPQDDWFDESAFDALGRARFTISPQSDRMGYRLSGMRVDAPAGNMISDATFVGSLQVPPSGEPILLMADRQTTGGYPQIATVITADLPAAGQLAPGDWVEFEWCTRQDAIAALTAQEQRLHGLG